MHVKVHKEVGVQLKSAGFDFTIEEYRAVVTQIGDSEFEAVAGGTGL